jgi:hypothetical protein
MHKPLAHYGCSPQGNGTDFNIRIVLIGGVLHHEQGLPLVRIRSHLMDMLGFLVTASFSVGRSDLRLLLSCVNVFRQVTRVAYLQELQ